MINNKPDVRFTGFNEEWGSFLFSDIVNRITVQSNDARLPKVEFEDIISGDGKLNKDVSQKFDGRKGIIFEPNFILYGKLRPYLKNWLFPDFKGIALGDFWVFEAKNTAPSFIYYLIQGNVYQAVANLSAGSKMPRSDWKTVSKTEFKVPLIEEQTQIGEFLKDLDQTIDLHQQELTTLKKTKRGFLQKMFPREGESVPEVRFSGFTGEWEQRKLGDVVEIKSGWSPSDFVVSKQDNGKLYIKVDDLNYSLREQSDSRMKVNSHARYSLISKGSTIFPKRGAAILTNKVRVLGNDGYMDTNMMALEPIRIERNFLYTFIEKTGLFKIADTSTIPQINNKHIDPYKILLPIKQEQEVIGEFFEQLDKNIALYQRELDDLKETKKAFLQKMFV